MSTPTITEAAKELLHRYKEDHPILGAAHLVLIALTGGVWAFYLLGRWYSIWVGWDESVK